MTTALCAVATALAVIAWPSRPGGSRRPRGPDAAPTRRPSARASVFDLADALSLLALAMRSGTGSVTALERVAAVSPDPIRNHLRSVAAAARWGVDAGQLWDYVPGQWQPAATAWRIATVAGAPPAALLGHAADRIRDTEVRRLEAAASRAGSLLVLPLGCAFLPAFVCTTIVPAVVALASSVLRP
jgi:pilus assembly protein TadC